jgi:hypothetical protein
MANAEARHGIGRQRRDLFNEAGDVINGLTARAETAEKDRDAFKQSTEHYQGALYAQCQMTEAAEKRVAALEALRDNQQFLLEYIEEHFPQAMDEAEHALAEWDGPAAIAEQP